MNAVDDETQREDDPRVRAAASLRDQATDILRHAATVQSRLDEVQATAARERERLEVESEKLALWLERETESDRRELARLIAAAEAIARERLRNLQSGDKKELSTRFGEITARKQQPEYQRDEAALRGWAESNGFMSSTTTERVDWDAIRKSGIVVGGRLVVDGSVVDGVIVDERPDDKLNVVIWQ